MRKLQSLKPLWQWRGVFIAVPAVCAIVFLIRLSGLLQPLEWAALDHYFRMRPAEPKDDRIVIVGLHESDVQKYGFPLPDSTLATALKRIKQQQPSAIGLDLYRDLPVGKGGAELTQIYKSTPNLIGVQKVIKGAGFGSVAASPVLSELGQVGANDLVVDGDGKLRRGLLSVTSDRNQDYLSFAFALSLLHLQPKGIEPKTTEQDHIQLGQTTFLPFEADDGGYIHADAAGYQVLLNYRGGQDSFDLISLEQLLEGKIAPDRLRGKVVLIGSVAESLNDFFETPYNARSAQLRRLTPGVEIHAQITSQILSSVLDQRPPIHTASKLAEWAWIVGWTLLGALLVWQQRSTTQHSKFQSLKIFLSLLIAGSILIGLTFAAFLQSWWLPVVPPLLGLSSSAIAITAYLAQGAAELRKTFGRYLTDEVVSQLLETPEGLSLKGERRKVTVVMADIRGFTSISEKLQPEAVVELLNLYLSEITQVVKTYGGSINDITGDGIVIFFGAPIQKSDDTERAIACAISMQLAMETVNQQARRFNLPKLSIGIGIDTGEVVIGNIGSKDYAKYTAIGSHVNLASRIESFTVGGQVLISESTYEAARSSIRVEGQMPVFVKGVDQAVQLYEVSGIDAPYSVFLSQEQDVFIELRSAIAIEFERLAGKHLEGETLYGKLTQLSSKGGVIDALPVPLPLTNLKLKVVYTAGDTVQTYTDIYAKVTQQATDDETSFCVRFTDLPAIAAEFFQTLRSDRRARKLSKT